MKDRRLTKVKREGAVRVPETGNSGGALSLPKENLSEFAYYLSLGYTEKEALRICSLTFRDYRPEPPGRTANLFFSAARAGGKRAMKGGAVESGAVMCDMAAEEPGMPAPEPLPGAGWSEPELIEALRTDSYRDFEDSGFRKTSVSPTSTFRTTYNTAAATVLLSNFRKGSSVKHSMMRTEELLNFLDYSIPDPPEGEKFSVTPEFRPSADGKTADLFVGIAGSRVIPARQNIVLLLDTSGSMISKVFQLRATIATVFARLNDGDLLSVVTYSSTDRLFFEAVEKNPGHRIDYFLDLLKEMYISGCTYGSKGIETAYRVVADHMVDGVNRVIMVTDGDLNFGITESSDLKSLIIDKKKTGAFFSAIGTGIYNLMDDKLETLAKNGNGNYFVINSVEDVKKCLCDRYESLVWPIATDVKAQVEFNPAAVSEYRLIGYENRQLSHEDFSDDSVIAEPFGSGSRCVALYELKLAGGEAEGGRLKYQTSVLTGSDEICTVSLRYKEPGGGQSVELNFPVEAGCPSGENVCLAVKCAQIAERLRKDPGDREALGEYSELAGYPSR
ncbi:MAG: von Willebrand factor type A domain-containing protein [Clostridia bacterium]|nr:von Willebrand factor type A domain-containing protein [Clostridia bacterium]